MDRKGDRDKKDKVAPVIPAAGHTRLVGIIICSVSSLISVLYTTGMRHCHRQLDGDAAARTSSLSPKEAPHEKRLPYHRKSSGSTCGPVNGRGPTRLRSWLMIDVECENLVHLARDQK